MRFILNGRARPAREGESVLDAARAAGVDIPAVCAHDALEPYGACRLCVVEVRERGKKRWRIVTSCLYPVADGLEVRSETERIRALRKFLLELLLARSPNAPYVKKLAARYGVVKSRFVPLDDNCILCGLCVRTCAEIVGANAIGFAERGIDRKVDSPYGIDHSKCIACGACTFVCPTGAVQMEYTRVLELRKQGGGAPLPLYPHGLFAGRGLLAELRMRALRDRPEAARRGGDASPRGGRPRAAGRAIAAQAGGGKARGPDYGARRAEEGGAHGMKRAAETIRVRMPQGERTWELVPLETSPCTLACPTRINARGYVSLIADGRYAEALELIRERNPFPGVCGRVCPRPCEAACTRGRHDEAVAVCALKRFVSDLEMKRGIRPSARAARSRPEKVAVIGAGPAGLSAAAALASLGYAVTIFEAREIPGGMMNLIPGFRLPAEVVRRESSMILEMGIELETGVQFGRDVTWSRLKRRGYRVLLLANGAWKPSWKWGPAGRGGALHAIELLEAAAAPAEGERAKARAIVEGKSVVVAGEGMMALDCARTALRLGARRVTYLVGSSRELAALHRGDIELAEGEGLVFKFLVRPLRLARRGRTLEAVVCSPLVEGSKDATGRRELSERPDGEFAVEADVFVDAHTRGIDVRGFAASLGLETTPAGTLAIDPATSAAAAGGVFAAGDLVTGPRTVVEAIASGQRAALGIHHHLSGETLSSPLDLTIDDSIAHEEYTLEIVPEDHPRRATMPVEGARARRNDFREVEKGLSDREARREARRCLRCGPCAECSVCVDICEKKDLLLKFGGDFTLGAHAGREFWSALPRTVRVRAGEEETEAAVVRTIARVDEGLCIGCGRCAEVCGYRAIQVESRPGNRLVARVDELACKGCGICAGACPTGAADQDNFEHGAIMRALASVSTRTKVLFVCRWARPARLELPGGVLVIETMCTGRIAPSLIVEAALRGSQRILVCGCREEVCHYGFGRSRSRLVAERARDLLRVFGCNPNVVTEISTSPGEFALAVDRWAWKSK